MIDIEDARNFVFNMLNLREAQICKEKAQSWKHMSAISINLRW